MNYSYLFFFGTGCLLFGGQFVWVYTPRPATTTDLTPLWSSVGVLACWAGAVIRVLEKRTQKLEDEIAQLKSNRS